MPTGHDIGTDEDLRGGNGCVCRGIGIEHGMYESTRCRKAGVVAVGGCDECDLSSFGEVFCEISSRICKLCENDGLLFIGNGVDEALEGFDFFVIATDFLQKLQCILNLCIEVIQVLFEAS